MSRKFFIASVLFFAVMSIGIPASTAQELQKTQTVRREKPSFKMEVPADWESIASTNPKTVAFYAAPANQDGVREANVHVIYKQASKPADVQASYEALKTGIEKNAAMKLVESGRRKVGSLMACYFIVEQIINDTRLKQYICVIYRGTDEFLVTFSAGQEQFERMNKVFQRTLDSFSSPADPDANKATEEQN